MNDSLPDTLARLAKLRSKMHQHQFSAYLVTNADPHHSEYSADHWLARKWLSGFTGSAGDVVITADGGGLWTDGRYFIQAVEQLEGTGIELFKTRIATTPTIPEHLAATLVENARVGVDGRTINHKLYIEFKQAFAAKNIELVLTEDLIADIWHDRPARPQAPVFNHDVQYAGRTTTQKLADIRQSMQEDKVAQVLISAIDDVMWLMNIRGADSKFFPASEAYAFVSTTTAVLFIDPKKLPKEVQQTLQSNGVSCLDYQQIATFISSLPNVDNIKYCPISCSSLLASQIPSSTTTLQGNTYAAQGKIIKNSTELSQMQQALKLDGGAVVQFMYWLNENIATEQMTELSAEYKLRSFRRQQPNYVSDSFSTIAGYAEHGAIMHYSATEESNKVIGTESLFLLDSGGQYLGGTTDITRTFAFGELTEQQKIDYTLVLKGMIRLTQTKFMKGTAGCHLDIMARGAIWQQCVDYKCGTGHGVGICLNVHEGPQNLSQSLKDTEPLVPGMTITVEPGVYREGEYGIRIENILKVVAITENQFGIFYGFETMTLAPIATKPIILELLANEERSWLNAYHARVAEQLNPLLEEPEKQWLTAATQAI